MNQKHSLAAIAVFCVLSLGILYYVFGAGFSLGTGLYHESLSPHEIIRRLPADLTPPCRAWLSSALRETADESKGRLLQLMPQLAVSRSAGVSEQGENREFIGVCTEVETNLNLEVLDANLDRALLRFQNGDTGAMARTVNAIKSECDDEIEDRRLTQTAFQIWHDLNPGDKSPCD